MSGQDTPFGDDQDRNTNNNNNNDSGRGRDNGGDVHDTLHIRRDNDKTMTRHEGKTYMSSSHALVSTKLTSLFSLPPPHIYMMI